VTVQTTPSHTAPSAQWLANSQHGVQGTQNLKQEVENKKLDFQHKNELM